MPTPNLVLPTPEEIKQYWRTHGCGLMEARRTLIKRALENGLQTAETLHDVKAILHEVLKMLPG